MSAFFPIPYSNQGPQGDLAHASSLLSVISLQFEEAGSTGMTAEGARDLHCVLDDARTLLQPVLRFLNDLHYPGLLADYRKARRDLIAEFFESHADEETPIRGGGGR